MRINTEIISKLDPCADRFENYKNHYANFDGDLKDFLELDKISYSDKVWVVTRLFTKEQNVLWDIMCAESVLHIYEEKYPDDKRPRKAIEAAMAWLEKPTNGNRSAAVAYAAYATADAYATAYAAAYAAAYATAYAAAYAADASAYAYAAAYATAAAADVAVAAVADAARVDQQNKNLSFMLMCEKGGE